MFAIVIPSRTDGHLDKLLPSIFSSQPDWKDKATITVADDGVSEECRTRYPDVAFVRCDWPFIFSKNVNAAVRAAHAVHPDADLYIMNDDTEVKSARFLDVFISLLPRMKVERWAVVSPRILRNSGNTEITGPTPGNALSQISHETIPFISVVIPAEAWAEIGPMDERFDAYGFDDVAFGFLARQAGWKQGWTSAVEVDHEWHGTFKKFNQEELRRMSDDAQKIFFEHYDHPRCIEYRRLRKDKAER